MKTPTTAVLTHLQRGVLMVVQWPTATELQTMVLALAEVAAAAEVEIVVLQPPIFPLFMMRNCILQPPPRRQQRPSLAQPSLTSPAFFLLHNWWATQACINKNHPLRPRGHPQVVGTLIPMSFVRLLRRPPQPQPSISNLTERPAAAVPAHSLRRAG